MRGDMLVESLPADRGVVRTLEEAGASSAPPCEAARPCFMPRRRSLSLKSDEGDDVRVFPFPFGSVVDPSPAEPPTLAMEQPDTPEERVPAPLQGRALSGRVVPGSPTSALRR